MRTLPFRLSLRLLAAIIPVVLLGVSLLVLVHYTTARREILAAVDKELRFFSQRAAAGIDELLRQRRNDLLTLSESPLIADYYRNVDYGLLDEAEAYRKELERYLASFAARTGGYAEILFLDENGRAVARVADGRPGRGTGPGAAEAFRMARGQGGAGPWVSRIEGRPRAVLRFGKAVRDETGAFKGALLVAWDLSRLEAILDNAVLGRRARAFLQTPEGRYPRRHAAPATDGGMMASRASSRELPWSVVVEAPVWESLKPLREVRDAMLATALAGLAALVATIILLVRTITRPIARLAEAARRIGEGDLACRIPAAGFDELGALSRAFNEMAERLEADRAKKEELQGQLIQAEKVAAAGLLLSSVAHELTNPLGIVSGNAQLLLHRPWPDDVRRSFEEIHRNALRCNRVVENMLNFVHASKGVRRPVRLDDVARSALELLHYRLDTAEGVDVRLELGAGPKTVVADFQQLSQVLVNLVNNACDAMAQRGRGERRLLVRTLVRGDRVLAEVQDSGPGVPPALGERIFEPFVTTKEVGRGTGLGLYISRQIAAAHGGGLSFASPVGQGATFRVELPASDREKEDTPPARPLAEEPSPVAGKRILVVDDEEDFTRVIARALEGEGDELVALSSGPEALAELGRRPFDLVISDIEMPGVKGTDLYAELRRGPKTPMLIVTGNSLDARVLAFLCETRLPYLNKPLGHVDSLRRAVRRLLAGEDLSGPQE